MQPTSLLGKELRSALDQRPELWHQLRLLSTDENEIGTLTEAGGEAAIVARADADALEGVALAFFCGPIEGNRALLADLPDATTAVVLSADANRGDGLPIVAGVNLGDAAPGRVLVSPHPGTVALAHLLHPLRPLGLEQAVATLVQPVSMWDNQALDQLFEQARKLLNFSEPEPGVFGHQLAFNLLPVRTPAQHLAGELAALLGDELDLAAQVVQGGIFHGFAVSLYVRFDADPGMVALRGALGRQPNVELVRRAEYLGPLAAAESTAVLVGRIEQDARHAGGYWLWAVMDNLTRGGALNALEIAAAVLE